MASLLRWSWSAWADVLGALEGCFVDVDVGLDVDPLGEGVLDGVLVGFGVGDFDGVGFGVWVAVGVGVGDGGGGVLGSGSGSG